MDSVWLGREARNVVLTSYGLGLRYVVSISVNSSNNGPENEYLHC